MKFTIPIPKTTEVMVIQTAKQGVTPEQIMPGIPPNLEAFFASVARPEVQARAIALFQKGLQTRSEVELNLGEHVAAYVPNA
jgi:hypothetical protein